MLFAAISSLCGLPAAPADGQANEKDGVHLTLDIDVDLLPHIADGDYWASTITLLNMDTAPAQYRLRFFQSRGAALQLPFVGIGDRSELTGTLPVKGSVTIRTAGTSPTLKQGFALLDSPNGKKLNGYGVFRQRLPWREYDFESVVPLASQYDRFYVMSFDNRAGSTTSMAIVNLDPNRSALIELQFWDENGAILGQTTLTLQPLEHVAFATDIQWPFLVNKRGMARFMAPSANLGVPALVLRFNWSGPFTTAYTFSMN